MFMLNIFWDREKRQRTERRSYFQAEDQGCTVKEQVSVDQVYQGRLQVGLQEQR